MEKKLFRIKNATSHLGGVSQGLAEYFGTDTSLIRFVFAILFFTPFPAFIIYLIMWVILPEKSTFDEITLTEPLQTNFTTMQKKEKNNMVGGLILVALGLIFTMREFFDINLFHYIGETFRFAGRMWPLFLIGLGIWLILKDKAVKNDEL